MSKLKLDFTDDAQFEEMLRENLPDTPPESIVESVTPWRNSINRILAGLVLCSVTVQFFGLQYILPTVGLLLLLLGFRSLRKENGYFGVCFVLTTIRVAMHFAVLIVNATIYQYSVFQLPAARYFSVVGAGMLVVTCLCFWCGLRQIRRQTRIAFGTMAAGALFVWYVIAMGLSFLPVFGTWMLLLYIGCFFAILYGVYRQSYALDVAGYALHSASVRVSNKNLIRILLTILVTGIVIGYVFVDKYPMDWQPLEEAYVMDEMGSDDSVYQENEHDDDMSHTEERYAVLTRIREELLALGAPESILNDMTAEDILACEGALQVVVYPREYTVWVDQETYESKDENKLHIQSFAVELEDNRWKMIHHFYWDGEVKFVGVDAILLQKGFERPYGYSRWEWKQLEGYSGRVLYDKNGETMWAPFCYLGDRTYQSSGMFWEADTITDTVAAFSFPRKAVDCRGYFSYEVERLHDDGGFNVVLDYVHQQYKTQYPVYTAEEWRILGLSWGNNKSMWMKQEDFMFYTNENGMIQTP